MKKNSSIARSAASGRFIAKPLGKNKAKKFAQVEGMSLNSQSAGAISRLEERGLKGDALRSAITGQFIAKRG
ncbi:hypothetical protein [Ruegeria halocynthiae]|uniref:hypothetical protein n=1 Tax=Ruegeria halocynthiae TaxID=985054 RepID=UPI00056B310E|nr:hypothetical protein [Ruegeria halocynthiae]